MVTMAHGGQYTHLGYYGDNGNHSDAVHVLVIFLNMYIYTVEVKYIYNKNNS